MNFKNLVLSLFVSLFLFSCSKDNDTTTNTNKEANDTSSVGITMVLIPAGTFQMGNTGSANKDSLIKSSWYDDSIVHSVTLSKSYYMSKYEITQAQYLAVMDTSPSIFRGSNLPVESITWYKAIEFCNKLSTKDGLTPCYSGSGDNIVCDWSANGYRLPTEAEWEYACKGGTTTDFYSGKITYFEYNNPLDSNLDVIGWYHGNSNTTTHIVGQKNPNSYGLFDMTGNVLEWCWDWYPEYNSTTATDPKGASSGYMRVMRGGSWQDVAVECRSSCRNGLMPDSWGASLGFRVARTY